jgi:hypothetical protein
MPGLLAHSKEEKMGNDPRSVSNRAKGLLEKVENTRQEGEETGRGSYELTILN